MERCRVCARSDAVDDGSQEAEDGHFFESDVEQQEKLRLDSK